MISTGWLGLLDPFVSFFAKNYKPILTTAGVFYAVSQLREVMVEHHKLHYLKTHEERTQPIDGMLFPQFFKNAGGLHLYVRRWLVPNPKGLVFLIHGFQEHIGRYEHVAIYLNKCGYSVVGMDHQGHGQSEGDRLHVARFMHYVEDFLAFAEREQAWFKASYGPYGDGLEPKVHHGHAPRSTTASGSKHGVTTPSSSIPSSSSSQDFPIPTYLLGHSMGGLVAALAVIHGKKNHPHVAPWSAMALSAPCMDVAPDLKSPLMIAASTVLSKYFPKMKVTSISPSTVSSIPMVKERYVNDVLIHGRTFVRARFGYELLQATVVAQKRAGEIELPVLIQHSPNDKLVTFSGSETFFRNISSSEKSFQQFPESEHELFNDVEMKKALFGVVQWFEKHAGKHSSRN